MANEYRVNARIDGTTSRRMVAMRAEIGISDSEMVRRALDMWLTSKEQFNASVRKSLALRKGGK